MAISWKKIWAAWEFAGTRAEELGATLIVVVMFCWPFAYIVSLLFDLSYAWAIFIGVLFGFYMGRLAGRVWSNRKEP